MEEIAPPDAETLIKKMITQSESARWETKRVSGKMVSKALETICAFANSRGGILALGVEDARKAEGQDRLFGLSENPEAVDELRRKVPSCLLPAVEGIRWITGRLPASGWQGRTRFTDQCSTKPKSSLDPGQWDLDAHGCEQSGNDGSGD